MPLTVHVIAGQIGAGKSAILHAIEACTQYNKDIITMREDTDQWQFYLEKFYNKPGEYAFLFQKEVECHFHKITRVLESLAETCGNKNIIVFVERSPIDVCSVFLPLNQQNMSPADYDCLMHAMQTYANRPVWKNARYYMVSCPVDVCMERILKRDRGGEDKIDLDYMTRVQKLYRTMETDLGDQCRKIDNFGDEYSLLRAVMRVVDECFDLTK